MSVTPNPDDGEPTVEMQAPAVAATPATETRPLPTNAGPRAARPTRKRRLMLVVLAGVMFVVGMVGTLFLLPEKAPRAVPEGRVQEVAAPPPPSPARAPDTPFNPKQMLNEIFEGRDRGHSVTAAVEKGALRISSSRPGYVYVLAAAGNESDLSVLFFSVVFPRGKTSNHIQAGRS